MQNLHGKTALVTGGSRGIGRALAVGLARAGASVCITYVSGEEMAKEALAELKQIAETSRPFMFKADVRVRSELKALSARILKEWGSLDILVNNAGVCVHVAAEEMSEEQFDYVMDVNVRGVFSCCQVFGELMRGQGGGSIVNISSMSGQVVNRPQKQAVYNASKAAVDMLSKCLAYEWAKDNVRVNSIAPGYIYTEMTAASALYSNNREKVNKDWLGGSVLQRFGEPEELVSALLYLVSDSSGFTTGSVVTVDGGYTAL